MVYQTKCKHKQQTDIFVKIHVFKIQFSAVKSEKLVELISFSGETEFTKMLPAHMITRTTCEFRFRLGK